ncbi:MarR family winged helix-turn-helix transcriptional regulator [Okibacterium fritillariae]|uniref:MarR family winged helix-turn-helix transcriptional regulator n=1 Tax=Okibacterium fritillariae TaxID=123320 RepID=UPI004055511E
MTPEPRNTPQQGVAAGSAPHDSASASASAHASASASASSSSTASPTPPASVNPEGGPMDAWPTGRLLSTASRLVEHAWAEALESHGLTHAGLIVLHFLSTGPASQIELARRARVQTQTMSRTLDRLERDGYVERSADASDRRRHVVVITPEGADAFRRAHDLEATIFPELPQHDVLREALLHLIAATETRRWGDLDD